MTVNKMSAPITLENGNSTFSFLEGGDTWEWMHGNVMINAFRGNPLDGSLNNIYLRIYPEEDLSREEGTAGRLLCHPLTGSHCGGSFRAGRTSLEWIGSAGQVSYQVLFRLAPGGVWFWDITLEGDCRKADVIYTQDLGVATRDSIATNELYTAQYLGHSVFVTDTGYCVCSRQNMKQGGANPYVQQGSLGIRCCSYSTDGTQFFGLSWKKTNIPQALEKGLPSINRQFELAQVSLQTEPFPLSGSRTFSFYGLCLPDHPAAVRQAEYGEVIRAAFACRPEDRLASFPSPAPLIDAPYSSPEWSQEQITHYFPRRKLEEFSTEAECFSPETADVTRKVQVSPPEMAGKPLKAQVSAPEAAGSSLKAQVLTPEAAGSSLKAQVSAPEAAGSSLKAQVSAPEAAGSSLKAQVLTPEAAGSSLKAQVLTPEAADSSLKAQVSTTDKEELFTEKVGLSKEGLYLSSAAEKSAPKNREKKTKKSLWSFFTPGDSHVVLQAKELAAERPHGHILMTGFQPDRVPRGVVASSNYMYGVFNCQLAAGNTNMNKLLSVHRGLLNTDKTSGQRIYVRMNGVYRQLALPAAYEMDFGGSSWYYQVEDDVLIVRVFAVHSRTEIVLQVHSELNRSYDFLVTHRLAAGPDDFSTSARISLSGSLLTVRPAPGCATETACPDLHFTVRLPENSSLSDDRVLFRDGKPRNSSLLTTAINDSSRFEMIFQGQEGHDTLPFLKRYDYAQEQEAFRKHYDSLTRHFHLEGGAVPQTVQKLNTTMRWYTHDALIHFASPHGLEQSGGAAWGTRDICQGPVEFFLSTRHYRLVRDILLTVYAHQLAEDGQWPQWFMFDDYSIHQQDCHGDVVFWPLKALADYLLATGDSSLLEETADYRLGGNASPAGQTESLLCHIGRAVDAVRRRFLPGTFLLSYAGGDWDDTLQPASPQLRENLVSAWTQALAAQTLSLLGRALEGAAPSLSAELTALSGKIAEAFSSRLIRDGVIAGFLYLSPEGGGKYLLHPEDTETSIHYRLLPLTRSIIARLAPPELAEQNCEIIRRHLSFPDGVRLMDRPAGYDGGISHIFLRAEQAANIGREISLQYVHAHIRYIQAMAIYGRARDAWDALLRVNPILLTDLLPSALPRQSNVYFSSSDGCFDDRYEYAAHFDRLKTGKAGVRGGWRLYSSGPGIYLARLTADLLGIRFDRESILIDPVLIPELDGLTLRLECFGREVVFMYHVRQGDEWSVTVTAGGSIQGSPVRNPYRQAGCRMEREAFLRSLGESGQVHVNCTIKAQNQEKAPG